SSTIMFLLLLFSLDGPHRDLHSFPTRRSSDLDGGSSSRGLSAPSCLDPRGGRSRRREIARARRPHAERLSRQLRCFGRRRGGRRDRKSTRLNSSHGSISYAVFCLKKKKKKKTT